MGGQLGYGFKFSVIILGDICKIKENKYHLLTTEIAYNRKNNPLKKVLCINRVFQFLK